MVFGEEMATEYSSNPIQKYFIKTLSLSPRGESTAPPGRENLTDKILKNIQYFSHTNHKIFVSNLSQIFLKPNLKPNTKNSANPFHYHFSFCIQLSLFIIGGEVGNRIILKPTRKPTPDQPTHKTGYTCNTPPAIHLSKPPVSANHHHTLRLPYSTPNHPPTKSDTFS